MDKEEEIEFKIKENAKYSIKQDGKWVWKNFFKMDFVSILFLIIVIFLLWGYVHDTKQCEELYDDPCGYADRIGCYEPGAYEKRVSENRERFTEEFGEDRIFKGAD